MSASALPLHPCTPPGFLSRSLPHVSSPACQHRSVITVEMSARLRNAGFRSIFSCLGEVWGRLRVHDVRPGSGKADAVWLTFLCTDRHQASVPVAISTSVGAGTGYRGALFSQLLWQSFPEHWGLQKISKLQIPQCRHFQAPGGLGDVQGRRAQGGAASSSGAHGTPLSGLRVDSDGSLCCQLLEGRCTFASGLGCPPGRARRMDGRSGKVSFLHSRRGSRSGVRILEFWFAVGVG